MHYTLCIIYLRNCADIDTFEKLLEDFPAKHEQSTRFGKGYVCKQRYGATLIAHFCNVGSTVFRDWFAAAVDGNEYVKSDAIGLFLFMRYIRTIKDLAELGSTDAPAALRWELQGYFEHRWVIFGG